MDELQEAIDTINSIKTLEDNWNNNGVKPFSEKLINKALSLILEFEPVPKVFPTANNSIQFEWENDGLYLEMEVFEDNIKIFNQCEGCFKEISCDQ